MKIAGYLNKAKDDPDDLQPTPQELEELLRTSNVQFDGALLDETD